MRLFRCGICDARTRKARRTRIAEDIPLPMRPPYLSLGYALADGLPWRCASDTWSFALPGVVTPQTCNFRNIRSHHAAISFPYDDPWPQHGRSAWPLARHGHEGRGF